MRGLRLTERGETVKEVATLVTAIFAVLAFSTAAYLIGV